jgi:hypothetical protein
MDLGNAVLETLDHDDLLLVAKVLCKIVGHARHTRPKEMLSHTARAMLEFSTAERYRLANAIDRAERQVAERN